MIKYPTHIGNSLNTEGDYWNWKDTLRAELTASRLWRDCSASGDVGDAVRAAAEELSDLHKTMPREWVQRELRECGAWERHELESHIDNFQRMIWLISCEIKEEEGV